MASALATPRTDGRDRKRAASVTNARSTALPPFILTNGYHCCCQLNVLADGAAAGCTVARAGGASGGSWWAAARMLAAPAAGAQRRCLPVHLLAFCGLEGLPSLGAAARRRVWAAVGTSRGGASASAVTAFCRLLLDTMTSRGDLREHSCAPE